VARQVEKPTDETIKETLESIVIAFILAFVFRAYVVEAFIIPTGSMAPTLLGAHLRLTCEQCGYTFTTDVPDRRIDSPAALCPMCRQPNPVPMRPAARTGDRILVHKYIYNFSEPRRWDVVVFKAPHDPETNFIKRLVGLPGESLALLDGNVYVKPVGQPWQIARKSDRPKVQRAVWQPIYHSQYIPLDGGEAGPRRPHGLEWSAPWQATGPGWEIDGRRSYQYTGTERSRITFDFEKSASDELAAVYPYNQFKARTMEEPIEDIRLAATVQPQAAGLRVRLSTTARLDETAAGSPPQILSATLEADGMLSLQATDSETGRTHTLQDEQLSPLAPGSNTLIELWYVDQEASVWIDGRLVLAEQFDLPLETLVARGGLQRGWAPRILIEVEGSPVKLHRVELDRDLYYSGRSPGGAIAQGALLRNGEGPASGEPLHLRADEFFCMGDNSPWSYDGRYWELVDPWIEKRYLHGQHRLGVVPRELMMGRAFFVYFPAPFPVMKNKHGVLPNFGDMRFIH
jgi:signal peptidase I